MRRTLLLGVLACVFVPLPAHTSVVAQSTTARTGAALNEAAHTAVDEVRPVGKAPAAPPDSIQAERRERLGDPYQRSDDSAAQASQGASLYELSQPGNSIRVQVRYPVEYGYQYASGVFDPGPYSCGAFFVSAFPASGARLRDPIQIETQAHMRSWSGMYVCEYLIRDLPGDEVIIVRVAMSDQRVAGSAAWLGGSQAQPPEGKRREIADGERELVLTAVRPNASLSFEMVYSGPR